MEGSCHPAGNFNPGKKSPQQRVGCGVRHKTAQRRLEWASARHGVLCRRSAPQLERACYPTHARVGLPTECDMSSRSQPSTSPFAITASTSHAAGYSRARRRHQIQS